MYKNSPYNPWEIYLGDRRYFYIISPDGKTKQWIIFYARSCTHDDIESMIKDDIFIGTATHRGVEKIGRPLRDDLYWLYTVLAFVVLNKDCDDYELMIDEAPEAELFFVENYFDDYHHMLDFIKKTYNIELADFGSHYGKKFPSNMSF